LRNRLPLADVTIAGVDMREYGDIIRDELNVKEIKFIENINEVADSFVYLITPKIGARLGGALKEIIPMVKRGEYEIQDGKLVVGDYVLTPDEFENRLTIKEGITGTTLPDNTAVVILNTEMNAELVAEGLANEVKRFVQDSRKAANLDVSDRIKLTYMADAALRNAIESHKKYLMHEALITDLQFGDASQYRDTIEDYEIAINIEKANA
jgi:isoleucyl-tRNA synthetase